MTETLLLILLSAITGFYHDINKPTEYALKMEDGSNAYVILQNNNKYACPLNCGIDHIHYAIVCENNKDLQHQLVYHISKPENDGFAFYCSLQKILSMNKITPGNTKKDIPEVVSASKKK